VSGASLSHRQIYAVNMSHDASKAKGLEACLLLVNGSMGKKFCLKKAKDHHFFQILFSSNLTIIRTQLLQLRKAKSLCS
jgi:hypothetical protein